MPETIDLTDIGFFVVKNKDGKFFRAKGRDGYGKTWVDSLKDARFYTKIGPARACASFFTNAYPEHGIPDIVKLIVTDFEVLDEADRVRKQNQKKLELKARREQERRERELQKATEEMARLNLKIAMLQKDRV